MFRQMTQPTLSQVHLITKLPLGQPMGYLQATPWNTPWLPPAYPWATPGLHPSYPLATPRTPKTGETAQKVQINKHHKKVMKNQKNVNSKGHTAKIFHDLYKGTS